MRILHILDTLSMGGAENLLIGLAGKQVACGHDVVVSPLVCPEHTPIRDKMEEKGVKVQPLKGKGTVYNPLFILRIIKVIHHFDIIHVHLFPALYWAGFAKMFSFSNTPLVYTEHSTTNRRRGNFVLRTVDRFIYQNGYKMVIACSEKALETYQKTYPAVKHVSFINNGVDIKNNQNAVPYAKKDFLGLNEDGFIVTMVARFMPVKRQDIIVEAIAKLPSDIHAVFVGGNIDDRGVVRISSMADKMGVSDRVHFLYVRTDVPRILKTSDVILMASDYEGLSLSSIEGMAAGKPFVASNVDGLREVVGGAGILFDNTDIESLIQPILKLYSDKDFYDKVAAKCSKRAGDYALEGMVNDYIEVYQKALAKKARMHEQTKDKRCC